MSSYGFNEDRSKVPMYSKDEVDENIYAEVSKIDLPSISGVTGVLLFVTSNISTFSPPTGVSKCLAYNTSNLGLYFVE